MLWVGGAMFFCAKPHNLHYDNRQKVAVKCSLCAPRRNSDGVVDPALRGGRSAGQYSRAQFLLGQVTTKMWFKRRAVSGGLFPRRRGKGPTMCFPRASMRLPPSAVRTLIRSPSAFGNPPSTASIECPMLVPVSADGSAKDRNCTFASVARPNSAGPLPQILRET
jgi:hypothetical protein